jgi:hypothetical protein
MIIDTAETTANGLRPRLFLVPPSIVGPGRRRSGSIADGQSYRRGNSVECLEPRPSSASPGLGISDSRLTICGLWISVEDND